MAKSGRETRAGAVLRLLRSRPGKWFSGLELWKAGGGLRYGAAIHRLRKGEVTGEPVRIETKAIDAANGVWAYRLAPEGGHE